MVLDNLFLQAVEYNLTNIVKGLILAGVDVNSKNEYGNTALMYASSNGHTEIVKLLLDNAANNLPTAAGGGSIKEFNTGIDVNVKSEEGDTALILSSCYGRTEIVKLLLDNAADVNVRNKYGYTALMWASINGYTEIVSLLEKAIKKA